jgi:hypothetical protein
MRRLLFLLLLGQAVSIVNAQQPFAVQLSRSPRFLNGNGKITLLYGGEEKTILTRKSVFSLNGFLPADSVIELSFKRPLERPTRYFLYPNQDFNYNLDVRIGMLGILMVKDLSIYPEPPAQEKKGVLPKGVSVNKRTLGVSYLNEKTLNSDRIRDQWTRKGGKIVGKSFSYNVSYASMKSKDPTTNTLIIGGGYLLTANHYNLKIPEYQTGLATWTSFIYGTGVSLNLNMSNTTIEMDPPMEDFEATGGSLVVMLTGNAGYTIGLGKFKTETDYNGFAIDLTYKPSLILTGSEGGGDVQVNMKGFGIDINRTTFSAFANSIAPKAKSKFSFFMLPPIKDTPFMLTFGYGRVWYR